MDLQLSCCKSLPALNLRFLASFVNSKSIHQHTQQEDTNHHTSSIATARMEITRGPTYSLTKARGYPMAKRFHLSMPLFALPLQPTQSRSHSSHGPTSPMATSMSILARAPQLPHEAQGLATPPAAVRGPVDRLRSPGGHTRPRGPTTPHGSHTIAK